MSILRTLIAAALLALALPVLAQDTIETRMTQEEFKAAGLGKLSAAELARLNAWLSRTLDNASTQAAAEAKKKVESENRGFFNFGSTEPVVARISGPFRGFARGREYVLDNGHIWKQIDDASLAGAKLDNPQVRINPSLVGNAWYLAVEGFNTRAKVQRLK